MLEHLSETAMRNVELISSRGDSIKRILDIASNDGSLLSKFDEILDLELKVGIDPLISHLPDRYPGNCIKVEEFFGENIPEDTICQIGSMDLITSLSVLYDIPNLDKFVRLIFELLKPGGYWFTEQSYFLRLLEEATFDSVCHEHLFYLNLQDIINIAQPIGFRVVEVVENDVNGGSIGVLLQKVNKEISLIQDASSFISRETSEYIGDLLTSYQSRVTAKVRALRDLMSNYKETGKLIYGLGASTKGNVILHLLEVKDGDIQAIGDVNPQKYGRFTAVGNIPIVPEEEIWNLDPFKTVLLILPWHFKKLFKEKTDNFVKQGGIVIFPFPEIEVISLA
jgi:NDP-4-keto-2,6-dideoxyhexose 3-C-methyltransferase